MNKKINRIVFTGGGTLGHVYPMIPIIKKLKEKYPDIKIYFFGTKKGLEHDLIESTKEIDEKEYLNAIGLKRKLTIKNIKALYLTHRNYIYMVKRLSEIKPDIVIGFGGYVTGSVVKASLKLKIKTIIHEQNSVLGLVNSFFAKKVNKLLLTYEIEDVKGILVGNPRVSEFSSLKNKSCLVEEKRSVLVVGGSNGAEKINDLILDLDNDFLNHELKVTLITGKKYYLENEERIKKIKNIIVKSFEENMFEALNVNSIVISRAGSTTIAEVMALNKVCIFIPSPNVTSNHQVKNALYYTNNKCSLMIEEKDLNKDVILSKISLLIDNDFLREEIKNNIKKNVDLNACDKFIKEIETI